MSGGETLLYGYGIVCICMLIFNIIYDFVQRGNDRRLEKRSEKLYKALEPQLERIRDGDAVEEKYLNRLYKKLRKVNNLVAFDRVLTNLAVQEEQVAAQLQAAIQPILLKLALDYQHREDIQAAYFAFFISRHYDRQHESSETLQNIMLDYMKSNSLYCRINALKALYEFGSPESILKALSILDRGGYFFHDKILTDGLLSYAGDHKALIALFWEHLGQFSIRYQVSILNYIRFKTGDYTREMYAIMLDEDRDKELRLAAIRYFGKYVYPPAREPLLAFATVKNLVNWEYAAVSISCLAKYPGQDVVNALMEAMHSSNWYVRYNAAVSLESHDLSYTDLIEVVGGRDRYAREMMMYRLDVRRLQEEEHMYAQGEVTA